MWFLVEIVGFYKKKYLLLFNLQFDVYLINNSSIHRIPNFPVLFF